MYHLTIFVLLAAGAQDPAETAALVRNVEEVLQSDPGLLYHHQGYMAYLESHPEAAETERAYAELSQLVDFRRLTAAFDEALLADTDARAAFERYNAFLAEYPDARTSIDELYRVELGSSREQENLPRAFAYLRAHPDVGLRFLSAPDRLRPTPDALEGARTYFAAHPGIREELRGILLGIHERSLAHVYAFPWWRVAVGESAAAKAHEDLMSYLSGNPHKFWVWHRRQTVLATDPQAQKWIPYWYARVRRHPDLKDTYWRYLRALRDRPAPIPDMAVPGEAAGKRKPWPPEGNPPRLPPLPKDKESKKGPLTRESLMPKTVKRPPTPDLPVVTRPEGPTMPTFPDEPTSPKEPPSAGDSRSENRGRRPSGIRAPVKPTPPTPPTPPREKETGAETPDASSP